MTSLITQQIFTPKKAFVFINPFSGNYHDSFSSEIKDILRREEIPFDVHVGISKEQFFNLSNKILKEKKHNFFILMGGDGTLNLFIQNFATKEGKELLKEFQKESAILLINTGTGQDFCRELALLQKRKSYSYKVGLGLKRLTFIDLWSLKGDGLNNKQPNILFHNMLGLGIGATIVKNKNDHHDKTTKSLSPQLQSFLKFFFASKKLAYYYQIPQGLKKASTFFLECFNEKEELMASGKYLGLFASNGKFAGGGMKFAPMAKNNDALLNYHLLSSPPFLSLLKELAIFLTKGLSPSDFVKEFNLQKGFFKTNVLVDIEVDGEYLGTTKEVTIDFFEQLPLLF